MFLILTILSSNAFSSVAQDNIIPPAKNLQLDGKNQLINKKVILLYVSAPHCAFCKKLEKEVLYPLIHSGEYESKIVLRKLNWRAKGLVVDFDGIKRPPSKILERYHIKITPTLLFLDSNGKQVNQKLLGYRGGEFYWYYFDVAIDKANKNLN